MPVLGGVNTVDRSAQYSDSCLVKRKCQIVWHLTANGNDYSQRPLFRADTENGLQAQLFEIESVALIVVRADGFRVAVHNNGMVAKLPQCLYGIH